MVRIRPQSGAYLFLTTNQILHLKNTQSTWVDYKALKSQISILSVLQAFKIELPTQNGTQFYGACPIPAHSGDRDNKHAFSVNTEKGCYRCITHCGGGNVIDLYARLSNRDPSDKTVFREVAVEMQERFLNGSSTATPFPTPAPKPKKEVPKKPSENKPLTIRPLQLKHDIPFLLEEKKLPLELLEEFGIGFCNRGLFSGRVVVRLDNHKGELIGYAGRGMKEADITKRGRWMLPSGFSKSLQLFNQHRATPRVSDWDCVVVVEGFWSCLRWHMTGLPVVALMGSELSDEQLQRITEITDRVWLMLDNDKAGTKAQLKVLQKLASSVSVRLVNYPVDDEGNDRQQPEDFTPDELKELISV